MKSMLADDWQHRLTDHVLESGSRIDQASIEEDPTGLTARFRNVVERQRDGTPYEGDCIHPWQRTTIAEQFLLDDTPPRFFHRGIAAPSELRQQR